MVRETGQHDLQSEDTSFVPLEEERGPDATPQILHEEGSWRFENCFIVDIVIKRI